MTRTQELRMTLGQQLAKQNKTNNQQQQKQGPQSFSDK